MATSTSFWNIVNSQIRGIKPEARVFVQDILNFSQGGPKLLELKGFVDINTSYNVGSVAKASIVFPNPRDKYFRKKHPKEFAQMESGQTTEYLENILAWPGAAVHELNIFRRVAERLGAFRTPAARIAEYIDNLYDLGTGGRDAGFATPFDNSVKGGSNPTENLLALGLMQRIWVDFKGRDGRWYAGFTGIITGINESVPLVTEPTLTLSCSGMMRLLQLTQIYTQESVQILEKNRAIDILSMDPSARNVLQSTVFSEQSGTQIINTMVNTTQVTFSWDAYYQFLKDQQAQGVVSQDFKSLSKSDFFYVEPFWVLPRPEKGELKGTFEGKSLLRMHPTRGESSLEEGDLVDDLRSEFLIDKHITDGPQAISYSLMLRGAVSLFQTTRMDAFSIVQNVAKLTFYDFIELPTGDLVFQIPKLNNFPADIEKPSDSKIYSFGSEGSYDYSPDPEFFYQKGHGKNYVVGDASITGWSRNMSEEPLVTHVETPGGISLVQFSEELNAMSVRGRTSTSVREKVPATPGLKEMQGRFGLRLSEAPQVILRDLHTNGQTQAVLDLYSDAFMNRHNAKAHTMSIPMKDRCDLSYGNTVFAVERQVVGYISGITQAFSMGNGFSTNVQCEFVHFIWDRIPNPWISVRDLVASTAVTTDGLSDQQRKVSTNNGYVPQDLRGKYNGSLFIQRALAAVRVACKEKSLSETSARFMVAQACVETGFGRSLIANNMFNITANEAWRAKGGGVMNRNDPRWKGDYRPQPFRTYPDITDSAKDYIEFVSTLSRYSKGWELLQAGDPEFSYELGRAGYHEISPRHYQASVNAAYIHVSRVATQESTTKSRSVPMYLLILAQFDLSSFRYAIVDEAKSFNPYVWDVTRFMNAEIPAFVNNKELVANTVVDWLSSIDGANAGWLTCSRTDAVARANLGFPTVVVWKNPGIGEDGLPLAGHEAMVMPGNNCTIAQAGNVNFYGQPIENGFPNMTPLLFFTHD